MTAERGELLEEEYLRQLTLLGNLNPNSATPQLPPHLQLQPQPQSPPAAAAAPSTQHPEPWAPVPEMLAPVAANHELRVALDAAEDQALNRMFDRVLQPGQGAAPYNFSVQQDKRMASEAKWSYPEPSGPSSPPTSPTSFSP